MRRMPASVRAKLTGDPADHAAAQREAQVQWATPPPRRDIPSVHVNGQIYVNVVAYRAMGEPAHVEIGRLDELLIIRPCTSEAPAGYTATSKQSGALIGNATLTRRLGLDTGHWLAAWDEDCGWLECWREAGR